MLNIQASPSIMYLTVLFVILFKISFGLHLNFGLAQLLHDLSSGNSQLFNIGNNKESKSSESGKSANAGLSGSLNLSTDLNSSIVGDNFKSVSDTATETLGGVLKDTSENNGEKAGKALNGGGLATKAIEAIQGSVSESSNANISEKAGSDLDASILGDSLKGMSETAGSVLQGSVSEGSSETVSGKSDATLDSSILEDSAKSLPKITGKIFDSSALKGLSENVGKLVQGSVVETVSGAASKTLSGGISEDSLKGLSENAGKAVQGSVVETVSGTASKALSGGILEKSLNGLPEKAGKVVQGSALAGSLGVVTEKAGKDSDPSIIQASLENVSKIAGKATQRDVLKDSSSENTGKALQGSILEAYLGTVNANAGKALPSDNLEDSLGKVVGKASKEVSGSISGISVGNIGGTLKDSIQESVSISNKVAINSDQSSGEKCAASSLTSVPAISTFVNTFRKQVHSSNLLTILFNVTDATPVQLSRFKYRFITDLFRKLGYIDAKDLAAVAVRFIAKYFDALHLDVLEKVYSNACAFYLFTEGILTTDNADKLALSYITSLTESSEANDVICDCDFTRKFQAVGEGFSNFLFSVDQISKQKAWEMSFYYAHAWLLAAVDRGSLIVLSVKK